jgi:hypothetical protein
MNHDLEDRNDTSDRDLRLLAQALVRDAPEPPPLDHDGATAYVELHRRDATAPPRRVLAGVAVALVLVIAGGVALTQGRSSVDPSRIDAGSGPTTTSVASATSGPTPFDPAGSLLEGRYLVSRSSWDDPTQSTLTPIGADEIPVGLISPEQALAAVPSAPMPCQRESTETSCWSSPYAVARLAHFQGFAGYTAPASITVPDPNEPRRDAIVWVLVRSDQDLANSHTSELRVPAVLVDAVTGEIVSSGDLRPAP